MDIGVPQEIKDREYRVGLTPAAVRALSERSHRVLVQTGAGDGAGFSDVEYEQAGAELVADAAAAYAAHMVVKVKEPLPAEYGLLRSDSILFTYLHLAADRGLTAALIESGATCIAYETVQLENGLLPLLAPMSAIAGRLAVQFGAHYLTRPCGGRGVLLGGVPGVRPGCVTILGGGVVGTEAAKMAVGLGARVRILDVNVQRLNELGELFGSRVELLYSTAQSIEECLQDTDLLVGAVLLTGQRAPTLVPRSLVAQMVPRSVIVDVAVDQGGCIETIHPTTHSEPIYEVDGVVHYGVANIPGATPWTSTQALVNSTLPYVLALSDLGVEAAFARDPALARGLNVADGCLKHDAVRAVFPDL
ncbi:MAG: alanine dehydrogenase [Cyanobacteria bacterium P01_F01_bin.33]